MIKAIDAHQHFWSLQRNDYGWLTPDISALYRDFLPNDLAPILKANHIDGTVLVQAAPTLEETHYLLELAHDNHFIKGVVGWVDMESEKAAAQLQDLKKNKFFCGIRPMIQDMQDDAWMLAPNLTPAFDALEALELTFDALIFPRHISYLLILLDRHPHLKIVVDHMAKPNVKDNEYQVWATGVSELAQYSTLRCKVSGLLTEAGQDHNFARLQPYFDHVFECFGPDRLMWGSDWPVLTMVDCYQRWYEMCCSYIDKNCSSYAKDFFRTNAIDFYQLI